MLSQDFENIDVGEVYIRIFRNPHIARNIANGIINLDQSRYLKNVFSIFNMNNCKLSKTPMEVGLDLKKTHIIVISFSSSPIKLVQFQLSKNKHQLYFVN